MRTAASRGPNTELKKWCGQAKSMKFGKSPNTPEWTSHDGRICVDRLRPNSSASIPSRLKFSQWILGANAAVPTHAIPAISRARRPSSGRRVAGRARNRAMTARRRIATTHSPSSRRGPIRPPVTSLVAVSSVMSRRSDAPKPSTTSDAASPGSRRMRTCSNPGSRKRTIALSATAGARTQSWRAWPGRNQGCAPPASAHSLARRVTTPGATSAGTHSRNSAFPRSYSGGGYVGTRLG